MSATTLKGAADCHAHVFGPGERFPFIAERGYTPREALPHDYRAMLAALGVERGVIVQPSVYGTDNRATLHAIKELGANFRGVAVLPPDVSDRDLATHAEGGIRGVRLSDLMRGAVPLVHLEAMAARLRGSDWHIQIFADFTKTPALVDRIRRLGVPVVVDHLGLIDPARGVTDPGFQGIVGLLRDGLAWLKLSGPYLSSRSRSFGDVEAIAAGYVEAAPARLVWGSDWPHPSAAEAPPDDLALLALLERWAPDAAVRQKILVDNPTTLYGFPPP